MDWLVGIGRLVRSFRFVIFLFCFVSSLFGDGLFAPFWRVSLDHVTTFLY